MKHTAEQCIRLIKLHLIFDLELDESVKEVYYYSKELFDNLYYVKESECIDYYYNSKEQLVLILDNCNKEYGFKSGLLVAYFNIFEVHKQLYTNIDRHREPWKFINWYVNKMFLNNKDYKHTSSSF